ncbi:hypothetical protein PMAYCL1PPCAC_05733, partial [Pristionchus mayeri]
KPPGNVGLMFDVADNKQALFWLRICLTDHHTTFVEERKKLENKEPDTLSETFKNYKSFSMDFDVDTDTDLDGKLGLINEWLGTRVEAVSLQNVYDPRKMAAFA